MSVEERKANAALIARAPDLLAEVTRLRAAASLALEKLETTGEYPGIAAELRAALAEVAP